MGHLYLSEIKDTNTDLYTKLMEAMIKDPSYDQIKELYINKPGYEEIDILEEIFVKKLSKMHSTAFSEQVFKEGEEDFSELLEGEDGGYMGNVTDTFQSIFEDFFGKKVKSDEDLLLEDSIGDIMMKIGIDIIFNKNSALKDFTKSEKDKIKKVFGKSKLSRTEALNLLIDQGYIRKQCT